MGKCQNKQQKLKDDIEKATETKQRTSFIEQPNLTTIQIAKIIQLGMITKTVEII